MGKAYSHKGGNIMEIILLKHPTVWLFQLFGSVVVGVAIILLVACLIWKILERRRGQSERQFTDTNYE